jgi:hypothetical protein
MILRWPTSVVMRLVKWRVGMLAVDARCCPTRVCDKATRLFGFVAQKHEMAENSKVYDEDMLTVDAHNDDGEMEVNN